MFYEELDDWWPTEDSWGVLMTKLFNVGETYIIGDYNPLIFELLSLRLEHQLSWGVVCCLSWLLPVTLWWQRPIPFGRGMTNEIWVCGGVVCLLFCFLIVYQKMRANYLAQQLHSCLSFSTNNKIGYEIFVSISSWLGSKIWPVRRRILIYWTYILPWNQN